MDAQRWLLMHSFYEVVRAGSFVGAARAMEVTASVVSKRVAKLEQQLDAQLLQRTTRRLSLTEAGERLAEHCARILAEMESSEQAVQRLHKKPRGRLRVTTILSVTDLLLKPIIATFLRTYPEVQLSIDSSEAMTDLIGSE